MISYGGWERKIAYICFDRSRGQGLVIAIPQHADLDVLGDPLKNGVPTSCCTQQFSRGFEHYTYQRGKLDLNGLEI